MSDDRQLSLALSYARFHAAADTLRCALNAESAKVVDQAEVLATIAKIKGWEKRVFDGMRGK